MSSTTAYLDILGCNAVGALQQKANDAPPAPPPCWLLPPSAEAPPGFRVVDAFLEALCLTPHTALIRLHGSPAGHGSAASVRLAVPLGTLCLSHLATPLLRDAHASTQLFKHLSERLGLAEGPTSEKLVLNVVGGLGGQRLPAPPLSPPLPRVLPNASNVRVVAVALRGPPEAIDVALQHALPYAGAVYHPATPFALHLPGAGAQCVGSWFQAGAVDPRSMVARLREHLPETLFSVSDEGTVTALRPALLCVTQDRDSNCDLRQFVVECLQSCGVQSTLEAWFWLRRTRRPLDLLALAEAPGSVRADSMFAELDAELRSNPTEFLKAYGRKAVEGIVTLRKLDSTPP